MLRASAPRRNPLVFAVMLAVLAPWVLPSAAGADTIEQKRREAARIADEIERLDEQASILDEDYNDARVRLRELAAQIGEARDRLDAFEQRLAELDAQRKDLALREFVFGSELAPVIGMLEELADSSALSRTAYSDLSIGQGLVRSDQVKAAQEDTERAKASYEALQQRQRELSAQLVAKRDAAQAASDRLERRLATLQGEIAVLVRQEQERRAAEARRRAEEAARRAAAARAAQRAAASSGAPSAAVPRVVRVAPPPSPGASGAVAAAMSQLGTPYRWGTDDPAIGFDCSGLTSWAWQRAGVSLPHSSRRQYASLAKVAVEDLQPGDLVFFGRPIHHVGMYVGNGLMVHAPRRGDVVKTSSVYRRDLVGAARPGI